MENTYENALKFVHQLDIDHEGWSESEKTLALYLEKYAKKVKNHGVSHHVSASTVKSLHTALTNLVQATDDEGWNNEGEDWEEQKEARKALRQVPKDYLR